MMAKRSLLYANLCLLAAAFFCSCTAGKTLRQAEKKLLAEKVFETAHLGISVYDVAASRFIYDRQGDKYFVPASNTKIPTCYAAMKYLGDSLTAFRYELRGKDTIVIMGEGAPDLLHPDYPDQRAVDFLRNFRQVILSPQLFDEYLGSGWAWSDYTEYYMAQRSELPVYGNMVSFQWKSAEQIIARPSLFNRDIAVKVLLPDGFALHKSFDQNTFLFSNGHVKSVDIPFNPHIGVIRDLLEDTLKVPVVLKAGRLPQHLLRFRSRPVDSVLRPMMHRSDNFFAEQMLLMVSQQLLGRMNDEQIIDTLLKTDLADLPQKPRWVDGSGLSRYNLFTPQDFVFILHKMQREFGMERIKSVFPTGGKGTLSNYYQEEAGQVFAKTGTLSGVVSLSGFIYTKKGKLLLFSVLVNNHNGSASDVRHGVERFVRALRNIK